MELFLDAQLKEDRSIVDLLTSNETFLNEQLARHYGIPRRLRQPFPPRDADRREPLRPARQGERAGGDVVHRRAPRRPFAASGCSRTSSPRRCRRRRRTCRRSRRATRRTSRDRCARCSRCTAPIRCARAVMRGWIRWGSASRISTRSASGGRPTPARRSTPRACCWTARTVDGPAALGRALVAQKEQFVRTVTDKLLTYAIGRQMEYYDAPAIRAHRAERPPPTTTAGRRRFWRS